MLENTATDRLRSDRCAVRGRHQLIRQGRQRATLAAGTERMHPTNPTDDSSRVLADRLAKAGSEQRSGIWEEALQEVRGYLTARTYTRATEAGRYDLPNLTLASSHNGGMPTEEWQQQSRSRRQVILTAGGSNLGRAVCRGSRRILGVCSQVADPERTCFGPHHILCIALRQVCMADVHGLCEVVAPWHVACDLACRS